MKRPCVPLNLLMAAFCAFAICRSAQAVNIEFVTNGVPLSVVYVGGDWTTNSGYIEQTGTGKFLFGTVNPGPVDFHIHSRLSLIINKTAAAFTFNQDSHFGFDSGGSQLFTEGPLLGTTTVSLGAAANYIQSGVPFDFEVVRTGTNISFLINGTNVYQRIFTAADPGPVGFRPWRSTMDIYSFTMSVPLQLKNLAPANGDLFYSATGGLSFEVISDSDVPAGNVHLILNGVDLSSALNIAGSTQDRMVSLSTLQPNTLYSGQIIVSNSTGSVISQTLQFGTFTDSIRFVEGEDYNFGSGQFIDNPIITSVDGPNTYLDQFATEGIDVHVEKNATSLYRIPDVVGTGVSGDAPRQAYITAQISDPGVADYYAGSFVQDNWLNYTRNIASGDYDLYARVAENGIPSFAANMDVVTSGSDSTTQTLSPLGRFSGLTTGAAQTYTLTRLTDVFGKPVTVRFNGGSPTTLRFSPLRGAQGINLNYFLLAPQSSSTQPPFVSGAYPAPGASNVVTAPNVDITIRNSATTVTPASVQLKIDGADVTGAATVSSVDEGARVTYQVPSALSLGLHSITLLYSDSAAASFSNQWQFVAADQTVLGNWLFDEAFPGIKAATNVGAIFDASGNGRAGTVNNSNMLYVAGSPSFGSTSALRIMNSTDWVAVPDPAGVLNFRGAVTLEAVIRTTNHGSGQAILAKNGTTGEGEFWWRAPGTSAGVQRLALKDDRGSAEYFLAGTNVINDGQWHHLAAVFDQSQGQISLWVDYRLDAVVNGVNLPGIIGRTADLYIGSFVGGGSILGGDLDLVKITPAALDVSQFVHPTAALLPTITPVSPQPGAANVKPGQTLKVSLVNRTTQIVLSTLTLKLDGVTVPSNNITIETNDIGATVTWPLPNPLAAGTHTAFISVKDDGGPPTTLTNSWTFSVPVNPYVVGYWQFDEQRPDGGAADLSAGVIRDLSGNGRNLTAIGPAPTYIPSSGVYGSASALHLTSSLDAVRSGPSLASAFNFAADDSFTIEASFRTEPGVTGQNSIAAKDFGANLPAWWLRVNNGLAQFLISQNGGPQPNLSGATVVNDGNWHHVAAVRDAVNHVLDLYVDYALQGEVNDTTTASLANDQELSIGAFNLLEPGREFQGDIDFVRISSAALTPEQFLLPYAPVPFDAGVSGGQFHFSFQTANGVFYMVEKATSLYPSDWTDAEMITGDGQITIRSYPASGGKAYYRLRLVQ